MLQGTEPPVSGAPHRIASETAGGVDDHERDGEEGTQEPEPVIAAGLTVPQWVEIGQRTYRTSTTWFDGSVRGTVQRNYAHFNSRHAPGSKYLHEYYRLRSQVFRPKTRAMIRRLEAAVAVALFATSDLLAADPWDDTDPDQRDAAEIAKAIIQYRLDRTIPWFQTAVGAAQEAGVHGRPIAHLSWRYRRRPRKVVVRDETGELKLTEEDEVVEDRPWIELRPIENIRVDPACDWRDPVSTSPYLIDIIPMYVGDVKAMIAQANAEYGGTWYFAQEDHSWWTFSRKEYDSVRASRSSGQVDPHAERKGVPDFEIVWIHRYFVKRDGVDYVYDMIDTRALLSIPRPVREVYPHLEEGERPYIMGAVSVEAHKVYPNAPAGFVSESQVEINEHANLRIDGIRNATLGRWLGRRGSNLDMETLKHGVANSVIQVDNIESDLRELKQQDVPSSAFAEADRLNVEFDEIAGNFSLASIAPNRKMNETVGGMNLLSADAAQVKEYEIRTLVETFYEPVLNMLYAMEQTYETDEQLLNDVVVRTGLPLERVLDLLALKHKVRMNVGFGATSPEKRIQRITMGVKAVAELVPEKQQQVNAAEVIKEIFGALGFKDGSRFYGMGEGEQDPEKQALMQENAELKQLLQGRALEARAKVQVAQIQAEARLQEALMDGQTRERIAMLQARIDARRLQLEEVDRAIALEANDVKKRELILQREALSHEITVDNRDFLMALTGAGDGDDGNGAEGGGGSEGAGSDGPRDLPGDDGAGTIARRGFNLIPFAAG